MENSLNQRDPTPQPEDPLTPPHQHHPHTEHHHHTHHQHHTSEEDGHHHGSSSPDPLVSPCKRLWLSDSPADRFTASVAEDAGSTVSLSSWNTPSQEEALYNTPEKPRRDSGLSWQEDLVHPYNSTLEKSEQEDLVSGWSSAEPGDLSLDQQRRFYQCRPPQDHVLLCTPVESLTCGGVVAVEEEEEGLLPATPPHPIPHNTPERSVIVDDDDDDSDGADIFINPAPVESDGFHLPMESDFHPAAESDNFQLAAESDSVHLASGPSITFADRTNLDGVRPLEAQTPQPDIEGGGGGASEQSVTFADQTNMNGAHRIIPDLPEQLPKHDRPPRHEGLSKRDTQRPERVCPRSRLASHPDPVPFFVDQPGRTNPPQARPSHPSHPPRQFRSGSEGNLLSAEELDHHRLSLQSYAPCQQPRQGSFARSASYRSVFQPQNLQTHFNPAHALGAGQPHREDMVNYGSIDGPGNGGLGPQRGEVVDYGSVDAPAAAPPARVVVGGEGGGGGSLLRNRQVVDGGSGAPAVGRLWYYGSVDHPQRIVSGSVRSLSGAGQPDRWPPGSSGQVGYAGHQGSLTNAGGGRKNDHHQPFVRSASRRTLPRLCSGQGAERSSQGHGGANPDRGQGHHQDGGQGHHEGHHRDGGPLHQYLAREAPAPEFLGTACSRPQLGQIREVAEAGTEAGSKVVLEPSGPRDGDRDRPDAAQHNSRGTLCAMSDPSGGTTADICNTQGHSSLGHSSQGLSSLGHNTQGHSSLGHNTQGHSSLGHNTQGHSSLGHNSQGHTIQGLNPHHPINPGHGAPSYQQHLHLYPYPQPYPYHPAYHAEAVSSQQGRADSHEHSGEHPAFGSQGSSKSQARGSQHSSQGSLQSSGGGAGRGCGGEGGGQRQDPCPGSLALVKGSRKRRVLETPGHVRVSAYRNCGMITVHVMEGRHFTCKWKAECDSYIKLSLIPEDSGRKLRLKSKPVVNTNDPHYDHYFSLELQESDQNKRLLVSIWHKDLHSGCSEFLGCMSFGVKGILRKDVSGWFHLLTEDVGKEKHLQVSAAAAANGKPLPGLSKPPRTAHSIPQINKDVYGLKSVTLHMEKRKNGFGFSVIEECPARVGRVDLGSPAEEAGLKVGDYVIKVNCKNVSRSTVKGVKNLIVKSGNQLVLEIHRCHNNSAPEPENLPPPATGPEDKADSSQGCKVDHHIYESIADGSLSERSEVDKENKENEMAVDAQFEVSSVYQGFSRDPVYSSTPLLAAKFGKGQGQGQGGQGQGGQGQGGQGQGGPGHGGQGQGSQEEEWRRQEAVHHLLSLEVDFIDFMMLGIQRYSQPLRHQILTTRQHATVFQNVEQLVDISWFHVQQIHMNAPSLYPESNDDSQASEDRHFYDFKASEDRHFASAVAMIYDSKVEMFCQAHEAYAAGLSAANCVLSEMGQNKKFLRLVKDPPLQPGQPSISAFIFRPLQHMKELSSVFQEIYKHTSSSSAEHATLRKVTQTLKDSVLTISNMSNARVQSLTSLSSHTRSSCSSSRDSCTTSSRASSRESISDQGRGDLGRGWVGMDGLRTAASVQTVRSVDRQVLAMQDRLVFTKDVPVFQLCHEDRHIIFQGNVFYLHGQTWSKILMTLLSDVLILCQPDRDGNLHVLCHPIFLQHLASVHTLTNHRTELVFTLRSVGEEGGEAGPQTMVFRTPSPQDLSAWKCLLDQRIQRTLEESVIPMEVDLDPDSDHDPDSMVTTLGS